MNIFLVGICSFLASFAFGIIFNIRSKRLLYAGFGGLLTGLTNLILNNYIKEDLIVYFIATIIGTIYAEILARFQKAPTTVYLYPTLVPLVPGTYIYYTMSLLVIKEYSQGTIMGFYALGIAGAEAIAVLISSSIIRLYFNYIKKSKFFTKKSNHC